MSKLMIFLDDERMPEEVTWIQYPAGTEFSIVRTVEEFITEVVKNAGNIELISFDHDIQDYSGPNGSEVTGYDLIKWLVNFCLDNNVEIPQCIFHTKNIIGERNMKAYYWDAIYYNKRK